MLTSKTAVTNLLVPPYSSPNLNPRAFPSVICVVGSGIGTRRQCLNPMSFVSCREMGGSLLLGFPKSRIGWENNGFVRRSKGLDSDGDFSLEAEILEFMKSSKKPGAFPSKKELMEAGRDDLVAAIAKRGGWLSLGWDLEEEERGQQTSFRHWDSIMTKEYESSSSIDNQNGVSGVGSSVSDDSPQAASSSGRSM